MGQNGLKLEIYSLRKIILDTNFTAHCLVFSNNWNISDCIHVQSPLRWGLSSNKHLFKIWILKGCSDLKGSDLQIAHHCAGLRVTVGQISLTTNVCQEQRVCRESRGGTNRLMESENISEKIHNIWPHTVIAWLSCECV